MRETELIKKIAEQTARLGGRAYLVGGTVRDQMLDRVSKDTDIEVHRLPADTLKALLEELAPVVEKGSSFGVFGLKGYNIDVALPRKESRIGEGHRDFKIESDPYLSLTEAARRRDFTVCAIYKDILTEEIIDPFDGVSDIKNGILRHVDDVSFGEDALRVLRAAQFAARFSFTLAPETERLCAAIDVTHLSAERVAEEMKKALFSAHPSVFFEVLRKVLQLSDWFAEVEALSSAPSDDGAWQQTMQVLDRAACLRQKAKEPYGFMLSALCHNFGTFSDPPETAVKSLLHRLKCPTKVCRYAENTTKLYGALRQCAEQNAPTDETNRLFDRMYCPEDSVLLSAAVVGHHGYDAFLTKRLAAYRHRMTEPEVRGSDLLSAGVSDQKRYAELIGFAHQLHLSGVEKEQALRQTLTHFGITNKK